MLRRPLITRIRPEETLPAALRRNVSWFLGCKTPLGRSCRLMNPLEVFGCWLVSHTAKDKVEPSGELLCRYCGTQLEVAADRPRITAAELTEALAWYPELVDQAAAWVESRQDAGVRFVDATAAAGAFLGYHATTREPVTQR